MSRGWCQAVAMMAHYERASEVRDACRPQALKPSASAETLSRFPSERNPFAHVERTTTLRWKVRCWTYRR